MLLERFCLIWMLSMFSLNVMWQIIAVLEITTQLCLSQTRISHFKNITPLTVCLFRSQLIKFICFIFITLNSPSLVISDRNGNTIYICGAASHPHLFWSLWSNGHSIEVYIYGWLSWVCSQGGDGWMEYHLVFRQQATTIDNNSSRAPCMQWY